MRRASVNLTRVPVDAVDVCRPGVIDDAFYETVRVVVRQSRRFALDLTASARCRCGLRAWRRVRCSRTKAFGRRSAFSAWR